MSTSINNRITIQNMKTEKVADSVGDPCRASYPVGPILTPFLALQGERKFIN